jgi:hypothetical protein
MQATIIQSISRLRGQKCCGCVGLEPIEVRLEAGGRERLLSASALIVQDTGLLVQAEQLLGLDKSHADFDAVRQVTDNSGAHVGPTSIRGK